MTVNEFYEWALSKKLQDCEIVLNIAGEYLVPTIPNDFYIVKGNVGESAKVGIKLI